MRITKPYETRKGLAGTETVSIPAGCEVNGTIGVPETFGEVVELLHRAALVHKPGYQWYTGRMLLELIAANCCENDTLDEFDVTAGAFACWLVAQGLAFDPVSKGFIEA